MYTYVSRVRARVETRRQNQSHDRRSREDNFAVTEEECLSRPDLSPRWPVSADKNQRGRLFVKSVVVLTRNTTTERAKQLHSISCQSTTTILFIAYCCYISTARQAAYELNTRNNIAYTKHESCPQRGSDDVYYNFIHISVIVYGYFSHIKT